MCGAHRHGGPGHGFRRHGFPSREDWLQKLQAYRQRLEADLENVQELIERLGDGTPGQASQV